MSKSFGKVLEFCNFKNKEISNYYQTSKKMYQTKNSKFYFEYLSYCVLANESTFNGHQSI